MQSPTVTVDAVGRSGAVPEVAIVEAYVTGPGDSAKDARAVVKDRAATLRESITAVAPEQVTTVEVQVQDTTEAFDPATDAPFEATERFQIECVLDHAESVVIDVTNAGGQIQTVQFQFHEETRQALQNEAIASAMDRAREKAERIAAAEGLTVTAMHEATTKDMSSGFESIVDEALASSQDVDLHPAPITVSESVEVVYDCSEE
ncbi:SIMPL domain-containing protein [Haloarcula halophila]|uniref:SIMPL domain-containing protein n=1 Tax=Haloarcula TaxID=2237 RepID=UPI0023E3983B|nr:SIMPL domain-containing protein [Halomicroarcula sp. DFY41]